MWCIALLPKMFTLLHMWQNKSLSFFSEYLFFFSKLQQHDDTECCSVPELCHSFICPIKTYLAHMTRKKTEMESANNDLDIFRWLIVRKFAVENRHLLIIFDKEVSCLWHFRWEFGKVYSWRNVVIARWLHLAIISLCQTSCEEQHRPAPGFSPRETTVIRSGAGAFQPVPVLASALPLQTNCGWLQQIALGP